MGKKKEMELVTFRSEILTLGFEVISLKHFYKRPDPNRHIPHIVNFHVVMFITEGTGKHEIDFNTIEYDKNHVVFINKGQVHRWLEYQNTNGFIILFTEDFLFKNQITFKDLSYSFPFNSFLYEPSISLDTVQSKSFITLIQYLYQEYHQPFTPHKEEILQCLLRTFILKIKSKKPIQREEVKGDQEELFIRFQKMIDLKIQESRNINDYCLWLSTSYKKLNQTCKALTKNTAKAFLDQIIILKAKKFLIEGEKSISEIAYLLGFEEPTNFTKYYKKHTSISPKEFQNTK